MSEFFDSEVVRASMAEIQELQEEVYDNVFKFPMMNREDKIRHIDLIEQLLEKQRLMYTRLSLSDDPMAKEMKKNIVTAASQMGLPQGTDMSALFNNMNQMISLMKGQIDSTPLK